MGRLLRAKLKSLGVRKESYIFVVTCSSVILYIICLYTLLHINNSSADDGRRVDGRASPADTGNPARWQQVRQPARSSHRAFDWRSHFDDGKIHEFERNLANPVDWEIAVKRKGVEDIGAYLNKEREKRERLEDKQEGGQPVVLKRGPPRTRAHHRALLFVQGDIDQESDTPTEFRTANASGHSPADKPDPLFPTDLFTLEQRQHGAVVFHFLGVIYMFVALAIVCDEFFVPSLDVIIEKLKIPDDVAGATFMAAGGSAPELFTSVMGVFVSFDDVGIGTIVGSAVFNILFVIGMCALFSKTVLTLTWWPLFRDCTFYSISLITLILFFTDNAIYWWEALLLLSIYAAYVSFMRWNQAAEKTVKRFLYRNNLPRISSADHLVTSVSRGPPSQGSVSSSSACGSTAITSIYPSIGANGDELDRCRNARTRGTKFRHGILQLMIHSIDPFNEGEHMDEKANNLHAIASLRVLLDATKNQGQAATNGKEGGSDVTTELHDLNSVESSVGSDGAIQDTKTSETVPINSEIVEDCESEESDNEPLDMSWPQGFRKRIIYVILLPILFPLWVTLPDTRTLRGKKYFAVTFLGSILWIGLFSYLMVWWANVTGGTVGIPPEVMGLTFLAAGTSIPDLITSVIVARKGFGDMAVSSSVGSNIFDVCVGLPLPWLLYGMITGEPVRVSSSGMACSVLILFGMLTFVVLSIAAFRWKMNRALGITMFFFYFLFVAVSLAFEFSYFTCPF